ncbi:MAG: hypothetical protein ACRDJS_07815 [Actinomycetota bacterium]|jgi:hypothetical protein
MKKLAASALIAGLVVASLAVDAGAARRRPVKTKLYLHGTTPVDEADYGALADAYPRMDSKKPAGEPKSKQITNYLVGPNDQCAGNNLFPVWIGEVSGTIVGKMKLTFTTVSTPGKLDVRVWPDVASLLCTSELAGTNDYPKPAAEVRVNLPPGGGTIAAVTKKVRFRATQSLMVQITPAAGPAEGVLDPFFARVVYDSPQFASSLQFKCIPARGKSCT